MGAVCSILMGIDNINLDEELIIVNSDQIIDCNYNNVLSEFRSKKVDGGVITFQSVHPRWSYARVIENKVIQTAEKNPISNIAIAGFYYFYKAKDFIDGSFNVIKYDDNYNDNYYTSSVYNQMILADKNVTFFPIQSEKYYSFYSSQKLKEFEEYLKNKHINGNN
jgi:dTDP-glucose pyrophosphorylase